ncbi:MAG: hypothetical protein HY332_00065 [Chloroflexi bacterium]|nr:hypothetical protein [Chloroflexota bacterium]
MFRRIFGLPAENRAEAARFLVEQGFQAVVVGAEETPESVRLATDAGLAVWACRAAFSVRGLPEAQQQDLLARDPDGAPQRWFTSGCPNRRELREAHLAAIRHLANSGAFAGFMLDGIRFASPNAGDGFFTCFCDVCRSKAKVLGFDFERIRHDVGALRDDLGARSEPLAQSPAEVPPALERWPGTAEWLRFRAACVQEHVREVRAAVDEVVDHTGTRFQLGAYLFTPGFAALVGQQYDALAPLLDVISPMIYRTLEGDACLVAEWGASAHLKLVAPHGEFSPTDVGAEVAGARALLSSEERLVPILQLADDLVAETSRAALAAGAGGLDYFSYRSGSEPYVVRAAGVGP